MILRALCLLLACVAPAVRAEPQLEALDNDSLRRQVPFVTDFDVLSERFLRLTAPLDLGWVTFGTALDRTATAPRAVVEGDRLVLFRAGGAQALIAMQPAARMIALSGGRAPVAMVFDPPVCALGLSFEMTGPLDAYPFVLTAYDRQGQPVASRILHPQTIEGRMAWRAPGASIAAFHIARPGGAFLIETVIATPCNDAIG